MRFLLGGAAWLILLVPLINVITAPAREALPSTDAIMTTMSRGGFFLGAIVPIADGRFKVTKLTVDRRANGDYVTIFALEPQ